MSIVAAAVAPEAGGLVGFAAAVGEAGAVAGAQAAMSRPAQANRALNRLCMTLSPEADVRKTLTKSACVGQQFGKAWR